MNSKASDKTNGTSIEQFLDECQSCGACAEICPFLQDYGTPDKIIKETPENSFLCTNCSACSLVCPQGLEPSNAIFNLKTQLIRSGNIPAKISEALASANGFAERGHKFPFSYYSKHETVFWPGCGLSGINPTLVSKTVRLLSKQLNKKIGIGLDCCFDPVYQIGDIDTHREAIKRIEKRLMHNKIEHIITGCLNCQKILSKYLSNIKVQHYLEILSPENAEKDLEFGGYLHHPCPSYKFDSFTDKASAIVYGSGKKNTNSHLPLCCGCGGGLAQISPDLSSKFTDKILNMAQNGEIVTYCAGCKGKLTSRGKKTYHILELITGAKPIEKPVSSINKWKNRLFLAIKHRINIKKLLAALFIISLIILTTHLRESGYISTDGIFDFLNKHKVAAPLLFIFIYAVGPSLFVPSLPLTLGAGFLWGPFWGVVFSISGATIGASVAFLVSRYIAGNMIRERFGYEKWKWLQEKVETHGWKAVAFARLVPIFPFPVLNYIFGITPIPFIHYLWSTFVFMLPACIAYVAFGSSMGELIMKGNIEGIIIGIVIASVAMLLPFALKRFLKKVF